MSTYLPPENVKAFVPITINPEVKVAIQENTLKRNNPSENRFFSFLAQFTSNMVRKKEGGKP
nr:unnamed protein product [Callosobruchus analis]